MKQSRIAGVYMKGMLSVWIIYLLKKKPMTGYDMLNEIASITGDTWHPTTGSLYPALHKMKRSGFVLSKKTGNRGKIKYTLTKDGEKIYSDMKEHVSEVMNNRKFMRVFASILWPDEPESFRDEIEAVQTALIKKRYSAAKKDYKSAAKKLRRIREELEKI